MINKKFLKKFIEQDHYLQNPPLESKDFINFCKERGVDVNEEELEFFEKEKLLFPIIRIKRDKKISTLNGLKKWVDSDYIVGPGEQYITYRNITLGDPYWKDTLLDFLRVDDLYHPTKKKFQEWKTFYSNETEHYQKKVFSYYSSFQIYALNKIKNYSKFSFHYNNTRILSHNIELFDDDKKIFARTSLNLLIKISDKPEMKFLTGNTYNYTEKKEGVIKIIESRMNWDSLREILMLDIEKYNRIFPLLLLLQGTYFPYTRSSRGEIRILCEPDVWFEQRKNFRLDKLLKKLDLELHDLVKFYEDISNEAKKLLGSKGGDWLQLWKNVKPDKKQYLKGHTRLGVEYLQWAIMLKRVIEDYKKGEILDIDELDFPSTELLNYDPSTSEKHTRTTRVIRNRKYSDPEKDKNYYHDEYKRLFYLANDFGLSYLPRVMLFVEGSTEETVLPKVFARIYDKPENRGIEIINFEGVSKLLSTSKNADMLRTLINKLECNLKQNLLSRQHKRKLNKFITDLKDTDIIISNWTSFISYNLDKWQIIPFFVSDNEGNAKQFLEAEKPIKFGGKYYNFPSRWKYIWGEDKDGPYSGKDFEFVNFSDMEIAKAIREALHVKDITPAQVKRVRDGGKGIKEIHPGVQKNKIKVVEILFNDLLRKCDKKSFPCNRPVFKMIDKVIELALLNHLPVDTNIEKENKSVIKKWLEGN